jgi:hypothetical protein
MAQGGIEFSARGRRRAGVEGKSKAKENEHDHEKYNKNKENQQQDIAINHLFGKRWHQNSYNMRRQPYCFRQWASV